MRVPQETAASLLDVEEAAEFCHVRASTMRSWILQNKVTYVKLGRRVFLRKSDLEMLIAGSVVPAKVRQQTSAALSRV
jgi:excisionase family DNA binding protein